MSFSTILHKRNSGTGNVPSPSALSAGEIAINTADGKLFTKSTNNLIKTFLNQEQLPYTLDQTLSSVNFQYGNNTISNIFASVLNGINNDVSGAGSSVVNGSDNDITADYAFIGNGANNKISVDGDYGAILGGQNNNLNHQESFIIGSNITSHLSGFTYVNNLSVLGKVYGDGSELNGVTGSGGGTDTEVRSLTSNWESTYATVSSLSAFWEESAEILPTVIDYLSSNNVLLSSLTVTEAVSVGNTLEIGTSEITTLYVEDYKVGIKTETPNTELTVQGDISATGIIYGDASGLINIRDTEVRTLTSDWESTYTTFRDASSTFLTSETDSQTLSFNEATKDLSISNGNTISLSALTDLNATDTEVRSLTSNWESTYATVSSLSAFWEESAEILPTVIDYLSSNNVLLSSLTVTEAVSVGNTLEIGTSEITTLYVENDKVGIRTQSPNETLTVSGNISSTGIIYTDGDVEITNPSSGIILRSPDNTRWRITISNGGTLSINSI